ncbi:2-oxoacid:ferredoxin oxidoreductase subunit beta [Sporomusa acidovorans]|uniref:Thiamine pyrophosphate enzyme TPP-binding domain-containing protein n=1 Tax=Sporomusa acidovorans (strain ATCC 49682 / DSM 3132 / Mol) TaxID=1123286 RepID=A0ABZ3IWU3_SPOA4|nr:2-oxoacid:ferredoxin oxidoreductase subunit beta [Sporomusa acidovorans]OZC23605.1 2-oxoglutarate oxidoreductase subunit KorB [Sporomusa acidovorans DSM 3132]SDE22209.1 2-oxoglutarate ferredoxin oxidoreductase subunit beta [Sporomusa acidovorans]
MEELLKKYYRPKLPHMWCPGCGNGIVTAAIVKAIDQLGLDQDKTTIVSGIGCSSRAPGYLHFDTLHTAHGRALPFATGIKLAKPDHKVIIISGDGDASAIGGNHFIHAARRNIDLTLIVYNNNIYGMTGGQYSPLTPHMAKATTAPYGNVDRAFDLVNLAKGAGATFVARSTTYHAKQLSELVAKAIMHEGFSVVEAMTGCPISFGRQNKMGKPAALLAWQRDNTISVEAAAKLKPEQVAGKILIGLMHEEVAPEYTAEYAKVIKQAMGGER